MCACVRGCSGERGITAAATTGEKHTKTRRQWWQWLMLARSAGGTVKQSRDRRPTVFNRNGRGAAVDRSTATFSGTIRPFRSSLPLSFRRCSVGFETFLGSPPGVRGRHDSRTNLRTVLRGRLRFSRNVSP